MDADFIDDLFAAFGRVEVKRMFSGQGIYAEGVIFAIISGDVIFLKTDETTRPTFERENATALTFTRKKTGQRMVTSYWRLPERLYDAPDELAQWARQAVAVARANKAGKKPAAKKTAKTLGKTPGKKKAGLKARLRWSKR
jgi:DNA transformation protein